MVTKRVAPCWVSCREMEDDEKQSIQPSTARCGQLTPTLPPRQLLGVPSAPPLPERTTPHHSDMVGSWWMVAAALSVTRELLSRRICRRQVQLKRTTGTREMRMMRRREMMLYRGGGRFIRIWWFWIQWGRMLQSIRLIRTCDVHWKQIANFNEWIVAFINANMCVLAFPVTT